jgi:hypothetical protein
MKVILFVLIVIILFVWNQYYINSVTEHYENNTHIDLVYTWVDGSDPKHHAKRMKYGTNNDKSNALNRFAEFNEFKYSLRSVELYVPWVNKIYIVTDDQVPVWLNTKNPKIVIVDHKQIFKNNEYLPTFNSQAIECNLHNIPNLSEYFIYCNNDMFFGNHMKKSDFLRDGKLSFKKSSYIVKHAEISTNNTNFQNAWINNTNLLNKIFNLNMSEIQPMSHQAIICKKSDLQEINNKYADILNLTSKSRFRSPSDIAPIGLIMYINKLKGNTFPTEFSSQYIQNTHDLKTLVNHLHIILQKKPTLFCINDMSNTHFNERYNILQIFFNKYYTTKSSFEK